MGRMSSIVGILSFLGVAVYMTPPDTDTREPSSQWRHGQDISNGNLTLSALREHSRGEEQRPALRAATTMVVPRRAEDAVASAAASARKPAMPPARAALARDPQRGLRRHHGSCQREVALRPARYPPGYCAGEVPRVYPVW